MANTQRTRAEILALFADNVTGQVSCQDLRDFVVTVMEDEFVNPGDFWREPDAQYLTAEGVRGWVEYSQLISEACSFGTVLQRGASGQWVLMSAPFFSAVSSPIVIGIAAESYAASTFGNVLRRGLVYHSAHSASFDGEIGKMVYLKSDANGSIILVKQTSVYIIGIVEPEQSTADEVDTNIWRFMPELMWGIENVV